MHSRSLLLSLLLGLTPALCVARDATVYIGTFTNFNRKDTGSKGIYVAHFDTETGKFGAFTLAAAGDNPSFLTLSPDRKHVYATSEVAQVDGQPHGGVYAFSMDSATGALKLLNRASSGGPGPTHIAITPDGKTVAVSNYDNGSIASLPVHADGTLGDPATYLVHSGKSADPKRQDHGYAHSVNFSADGRFLYSDDLGTDKLYSYAVDSAHATLKEVTTVSIKPGSGPRHLAIHPDGRHAYMMTEMASSIFVFDYNAAQGSFTQTQMISSLPPGYTGASSGAEVAVHPNGKFVYVSSRGPDTISLFQVDPANGHLTYVDMVSTQGKIPRFFTLDPSGNWLIACNQNSDSIAVYRVDSSTGKLTPNGAPVQVPAPVCVLFAN